MKAEAQGRHILDGILGEARRRAAAATARRAELERAAGVASPAPGFGTALTRGSAVAVIAEIKRRSPSAGVLRVGEDVQALARNLAGAGAAALSVLTEPAHFDGSLADLEGAARAVAVPVLRKDFILDEVQLLEARAAGAAAALLIVRILEGDRLARLVRAAAAVGLETLVEVHEGGELESALRSGARVIGVNARDLDTLAIDPGVHQRLLPRIPADCIAVAESSLATPRDVARVASWGADAVLVGTAISGSGDPARALRRLCQVRRAPERGPRASAGRRP